MNHGANAPELTEACSCTATGHRPKANGFLSPSTHLKPTAREKSLLVQHDDLDRKKKRVH